MSAARIITVQGVEYPNGKRGACYAIEDNGTAVCIENKRAIELQQDDGVPYVSGYFLPDYFANFFPPDFPPIGRPSVDDDTLTEWEREQVSSGKATRDGSGIKLHNPDLITPPARPHGTCPDCGKPITLQRSGWWTHDGLAGDCWRQSMDGPESEES